MVLSEFRVLLVPTGGHCRHDHRRLNKISLLRRRRREWASNRPLPSIARICNSNNLNDRRFARIRYVHGTCPHQSNQATGCRRKQVFSLIFNEQCTSIPHVIGKRKYTIVNAQLNCKVPVTTIGCCGWTLSIRLGGWYDGGQSKGTSGRPSHLCNWCKRGTLCGPLCWTLCWTLCWSTCWSSCWTLCWTLCWSPCWSLCWSPCWIVLQEAVLLLFLLFLWMASKLVISLTLFLVMCFL